MKFRTDIQALRGFAVLLVLLSHAKIDLFKNGYLGVDIFFVISGFLITGLIKESIEHAEFSFTAFYLRRAKRLLPAAYVTFFVTALLSCFLLNAIELRDFAKQLAGAITFTANIALYFQTGYFESAAELKPLLHIWSLAIEEQYYLLLPAALFFTPKKYWLPGACAILFLSLGLHAFIISSDPSFAFYLLPTRAWELAIGSIGVLAPWNGVKTKKTLSVLLWPSVIALVLIPILPFDHALHIEAIFIVCMATLVLILNRHKTLNKTLIPRYLAKVGDISYSLYLVHWPVFALLNNVYLGRSSTLLNTAALSFAILLGIILYRFVEVPSRHANIVFTPRIYSIAFGLSLVLVMIPCIAIYENKPKQDYTFIRRPNFGLAENCILTESNTPRPDCKNSDAPKILVWGDSFAEHLVAGIIATNDVGVVQATQSNCAGFLGLAPINLKIGIDINWGKQCLQFNQSVLNYLATANSIETVILSGAYTKFLEPRNPDWHLLLSDNGNMSENTPSVSMVVAAMNKTILAIRGLGKRVVIIALPPTAGFNIGDCLERKESGLPFFGVPKDCKISLPKYHNQEAKTLEFFEQASRSSGVEVISFDDYLCHYTSCATEIDGTFLYRDSGHLSYDGSRLLAQKIGLKHLIETKAK